MKYIIPSKRIQLISTFNLTNTTLIAYKNFSHFVLSKSLRFYNSCAQNSALILN